MKKRFLFSLLSVLLFSTIFCGSAFSKDIYLSSKGSDANDGFSADKALATFRKAYFTAQSGDIIHVSGIINLSSEASNSIGFPIVKDLTIKGASKDTDGFDGQGKTRLFVVKDRCTLTLNNLILKNGATDEPNTHGGAVVITNNAVLNGNNLLFKENRAAGTGGAIHIASTKGVRLINCGFLQNESSRGGAIGITDSANPDVAFLFENCAFVLNKALALAGNGGGSSIHFVLGTNTENNTINIINSTFTQNATASANGGTIYFHTGKSKGNVNIINCTIAKNTSEANSINNTAGIFMANTALKLNIYNSIIEGNSIYNEGLMFADLRMVAEPSFDNLSIFNSFVGRYAGPAIPDEVKAAVISNTNNFNYLSNSSKEKNLKAGLGEYQAAGYFLLKPNSPAVNFGNSEYLKPYSTTDQTGTIRPYTNGKCYAGAIEKTETVSSAK